MRNVSVPLTRQSKKHNELYAPQSIRKIPDGVVAALPDGIEMCQVCECKSSQSGKGGSHPIYRLKQVELIATQRATNSRNGPIIKENIWQKTLNFLSQIIAQSRSHLKYGLATRRFIDAFILIALRVVNSTVTYGVKKSVGSAMPAAEIEGGKL